ncbi:hypothetical protein [Photobacterium damselae]|uniref:hypothetical protein n=1 Tax=Photobacterium damselae TaxID=38293 RepID=UPI001F1A063A|nr:hypothetical protein [Photobacterium damselae]UKA08945.1 hypothetical protein IHC91_07840 [Photobacterium damselae subsp. damselae]
MFPTRQQYKKWSLPSKYSFLGYVVGVLSLILAIYSIFFSSDNTFETLVKKQYQPNVIVKDVLFEKWLGDDEDFLTVELYNDSKGNALNFHIEVVVPKVKQKINPTKTSTIFSDKNFSIKSQQQIGIPVISLSQLKDMLREYGLKGSLIGVGLKSSLPETLIQKLRGKYSGNFTTRTQAIALNITYKGMNSGSYHRLKLIYVYMDKTDS